MMKYIMSIFAVLAVLAVPASAQTSDEIFAAKARAWLLENPSVLLDAMRVLETRQKAATASIDIGRIASEEAELFGNAKDGYIGGGEAVIVEFFDYQCGYCKRQVGAVEQFASNNPNKRVILKEFPILGAISEVAARAALATKALDGNDAYLTVHRGFMGHKTQLNNEVIDSILIGAGLNPTVIRGRMAEPDITAHIKANRDLATRLEIQGTPGFVFNKSIARGFLSLVDLEQNTK